MSSARWFGNIEKNFVWTSEMVLFCMISWLMIVNDAFRIDPPLGIASLATKSGSRDQRQNIWWSATSHYTHLLRCFRPTVFPQILGSFARVFELAQDEMLRRFRAQGCQGLGVALSEGVAALGHYCFTGSSKALASSVLGPLKTMESLKKGAWPYLDPLLLDLRQGEGRLDGLRWPRTKKGRPIFLHVASLSFHYGPEVGASRHSLIWFRDLGAKSIGGPEGAGQFLEEVFRDLWLPEMVALVSHQVG